MKYSIVIQKNEHPNNTVTYSAFVEVTKWWGLVKNRYAVCRRGDGQFYDRAYVNAMSLLGSKQSDNHQTEAEAEKDATEFIEWVKNGEQRPKVVVTTIRQIDI